MGLLCSKALVNVHSSQVSIQLYPQLLARHAVDAAPAAIGEPAVIVQNVTVFRGTIDTIPVTVEQDVTLHLISVGEKVAEVGLTTYHEQLTVRMRAPGKEEQIWQLHCSSHNSGV